MRAHTRITEVVVAVIALSTSGQVTYSAPPPDQEITYLIHADPEDPESEVVFSVNLQLSAQEVDGNNIGWRITTATFAQDSPAREWIRTDPAVDTVDNLWWVTHADPMVPERMEFSVPPLIYGTADAQEIGYDDLDFEYEGASYVASPPPEEPPYGGNTTAGTYWFQEVGLGVPVLATDEEEPVETDEEEDF